MKRKLGLVPGAFAILIVLLTAFPVRATGPTETHPGDGMWVEPSSINLPTTTPVGYKFNVTVYLNVTTDDTFMYQIALIYNRTQLRCVRGGFTGTPPLPGMSPLSSEFMSGFITTKDIKIDTSFLGNGTVLVYEALTGSEKVLPPKAASLIWLEFEVRMVPPEGEIITSELDVESYTIGNYPNPGDAKRNWVKNPGGVNILDNSYNAIYTIPEFPSNLIPFVLIVLTLVATISAKILKKPSFTKTKA